MTRIIPKRISPRNFADFGTMLRAPVKPPTAEDQTFKYWSDLASYHVEGETEIGWCTVYRQEGRPITWMERHEQTPELLIPIDAPFILPVMRKENGPDSIEAFQVEIGEAVVIGQNVWHTACQPAAGDQATYFVIFRRGTPAEDVIKTDVSDVAIAVATGTVSEPE